MSSGSERDIDLSAHYTTFVAWVVDEGDPEPEVHVALGPTEAARKHVLAHHYSALQNLTEVGEDPAVFNVAVARADGSKVGLELVAVEIR